MPPTPLLQLPPGQFDAYIFDCDGTLADSMGLHHEAWLAELAERGCTLTEAQLLAWAGEPAHTILKRLNGLHGLAMPIDEVIANRERRYLELLPRLQPLAHVVEHVYAGRAKKIKLAVGSGGKRESVILTLDRLGLTAYFDAIVGAEDYLRGKPDPEVFLIAAQRVGVHPSRCLVFEDAELGVQAARAAGMAWVRV